MNSSTSLIAILLAVGIGACGMLWGWKNRNAARQTEDTAAAIQSASERDISSIQLELDASETEIARLQGDVRELNHRLSLVEDNNAELLRQRDRLELRIESLRAGAHRAADGERQWADEELDARIRTEGLAFAIRELKLSGPPEYSFASWDEMRAALAKGPLVGSEEQAPNQSRAYAAMGFVTPGTDVRARTLDLLAGQLGAALYSGEQRVLFNTEGSVRSVHDRTALAIQLVRALQDQHFDLFATLRQPLHNDDARAALWALAEGDSNLVRIRFQLQDAAAPADELLQSATRMTREQFERIPAFVREYFLFPFAIGEGFCQQLHEAGRWERINKALAEPPQSTAEILHPELFLGEGSFTPELYRWDMEKLAVSGAEPLWNNVAGELGIALLLNQTNFLEEMVRLGSPDALDMPELVSRGAAEFSKRDGSKAAAGWFGDRYLVYANGDGEDGSDHVFWRTHWSSAEEAAEFSVAIRKSLAFRRGVEKLEQAEGPASISAAGDRFISVSVSDDDEVLVIDAGSQEFAKALATKSAGLGRVE